MTPAEAVFAAMAVLTVASAWSVTALRNLVHAAFALLICFLGVAGLLVFLGADFLAATQVLVYMGGVMILILFSIMLSDPLRRRRRRRPLRVAGGLAAAAALVGILLRILLETPWRVRPAAAPGMEPTTAVLGDLLLGPYLLPFEVVSVLLLAALVGAVVLLRKETRRPEGSS